MVRMNHDLIRATRCLCMLSNPNRIMYGVKFTCPRCRPHERQKPLSLSMQYIPSQAQFPLQAHLISTSPFPAPFSLRHLQRQKSLFTTRCPSPNIPLLCAQYFFEASRVAATITSPPPWPSARPSRGRRALKWALTCMPSPE